MAGAFMYTVSALLLLFMVFFYTNVFQNKLHLNVITFSALCQLPLCFLWFSSVTFLRLNHNVNHFKIYRVIHKSFRDFRPLRYIAGMVTPRGSTSTKGETLQISVLPYRCSIFLLLVTRQISIL